MTDGRLSKALRYLRRSFTPSADEPSDRQLLARFAEHRDDDAFAVLVQRHGPMVLAACRRVLGDVADAEDAFQATFIMLARKAGARGWQDSIGSWLYEVAYRSPVCSAAPWGRSTAGWRGPATCCAIDLPGAVCWRLLRSFLRRMSPRQPYRPRCSMPPSRPLCCQARWSGRSRR